MAENDPKDQDQSHGQAGGYNEAPGKSQGGFGSGQAGEAPAESEGGGQEYTGQTGTGYGHTLGGASGGSNDEGPLSKARHALAGVVGSGDERRDDPPALGTEHYARSDERVRDDVQERLREDPFLDAGRIIVSAMSGVVTLSGSVTDSADKRRAEALADDVSGVQQLRSELAVRKASAEGD